MDVLIQGFLGVCFRRRGLFGTREQRAPHSGHSPDGTSPPGSTRWSRSGMSGNTVAGSPTQLQLPHADFMVALQFGVLRLRTEPCAPAQYLWRCECNSCGPDAGCRPPGIPTQRAAGNPAYDCRRHRSRGFGRLERPEPHSPIGCILQRQPLGPSHYELRPYFRYSLMSHANQRLAFSGPDRWL